jgi:pimeloyl-ACP methyl ester carboxylesterase
MAMPEPLVLVPGLNCNAALFQAQVTAFDGERQVMVADHASDASICGIAARLLMHAPERFALAGLSMGGYVCYEVLRQAPARVTRLALLDTRASVDTPEDAERRLATIRLAEEGRFDAIHRLLWPRLVHPDRVQDKALETIVTAMAEATGPVAFARQQRALLARPDPQPILATIRCPTLVVVGDNDVITPPDAAEALASTINGATLAIIPNCGHLSTLEQPDVVNAHLARWLTA